MKALVIGNGPSLIGYDPRKHMDLYDMTIGCNHAWQQWPFLDYFVMADRRNIDYTCRQATPDIHDKAYIKPFFHPNFQRLKKVETAQPGDISGTLGIRLARQLGATHIDCIGFDTITKNEHEKAYLDVPWKKTIPRDIDRWRRVLETAVKEVHPSTVHLYKDIEDV